MKIQILLMVLVLWSLDLVGQSKKDTIYVTTNVKTYIIFPEVVDWVDPGIDKYITWYSGNSAGFMADVKDIPPALLIIKYGNNFWHGTIAYKEKLTDSEMLINLSKTPKEEMPEFANKTRVAQDSTVSITDLLVKRRLGILEGNSKEEEKQYAIYSSKLIWKVSVMRQDNNYYYFKCGLFNRSKDDYVVETIDFEYVDSDPNTGLPISDYPKIRDFYSGVNPLEAKISGVSVNKKEVVYFYYSIPKISLTKKGQLTVAIWERHGTRNLKFSIPEDILLSIKQF